MYVEYNKNVSFNYGGLNWVYVFCWT